ncbi:MAG: hypothetical protein M1508_10685 [Nitrospirae bacterium]|nr:hypothetical protein [Nitrospirota bacterium]MCL5421391.1 hypothetical protein [Nitrospirota bacterium]
MKATKAEFKEKSACAEKYSPFPEFITCPKCREEIELWTDEEETVCFFCGYKVFKNERLTN